MDISGSLDDVLEVNVGGTIFTTRRSTLCGVVPDSMIAKLFDQDSPFGQIATDSSGRPFLDRDSNTFRYILDYLRRGGKLLGVSGASSDLLEQLENDAEYFGLDGLVALVKQERQKRHVPASPVYQYCTKRIRMPQTQREEAAWCNKLDEMSLSGWKVHQVTVTEGVHQNYLFVREREAGSLITAAPTRHGYGN